MTKLAPAAEAAKKRAPAAPAKTQRQLDPERLRKVAEMMAGAVDYYQMQVELSQLWGVSMRTIRNYRERVLRDMGEQLAEAGFMDPGLEKILGVNRLELIYAGAMAAKDFRTAMHVVKTRMLVAGVLNPERIDVVIAAPQLLESTDAPELVAKRALAARLARSIIGDTTLVQAAAPVTTPVAAPAPKALAAGGKR